MPEPENTWTECALVALASLTLFGLYVALG